MDNNEIDVIIAKLIVVWQDARRMRWLLSGNGYFLEEEWLRGSSTDKKERDEVRRRIDEEMKLEAEDG